MDSLKSTLEASLLPGDLRPVLTSLNGDNSWLMSFPRPAEDRATTGKAYFHIVFEPWLQGITSLLSTWFIQISLPNQATIQDPAGIEAVICEIESYSGGKNESQTDTTTSIDAILLGFHYLDHVHEQTLRLFDKRIPVIATPEAAKLIQPWSHFETVALIHDHPVTATTWRDDTLHPGSPLPTWITPIRVPGHHELNFVLAIIWTHADANGNEIHEALLNSPHGTLVVGKPLTAFLESKPETIKLAMLHGTKESHAMGMQNTFGAKGGLALHRKIGGAKYWVASHHSKLSYAGIFMRVLFVHDTPRTLEWALGEEKAAGIHEGDVPDPNFREVKGGACLILE